MIGAAVGLYMLNPLSFIVVNLTAAQSGADRNAKAISLLRRSALEPLAEIYGPVMLASRSELAWNELVPGFKANFSEVDGEKPRTATRRQRNEQPVEKQR
ncbi:MAG: hypothetical protein JWQ87_5261 [Candidatus Sulfotelmatobacter sp.]|nr:hypothetical protein [Candidatus Sulfotelmatobacter sp.]